MAEAYAARMFVSVSMVFLFFFLSTVLKELGPCHSTPCVMFFDKEAAAPSGSGKAGVVLAD